MELAIPVGPQSPYRNALSELYGTVHRERSYYDTAWRGDIRERLLQRAGEGKICGVRVLDVGCRDGYLSDRIFKNSDITGLDVDTAALDRFANRSSRHGNSFVTMLGDLNQRLVFADASFDAILMGEVIEHVIDPSLLLRECARILRPNGLLVGSTPNAARWDKRLRLLAGADPKEFSDPTHLQYFTLTSLRTTLVSSFKHVNIGCYQGAGECQILPQLRADGFIFSCRV